jgi:hypothetical protein
MIVLGHYPYDQQSLAGYKRRFDTPADTAPLHPSTDALSQNSAPRWSSELQEPVQRRSSTAWKDLDARTTTSHEYFVNGSYSHPCEASTKQKPDGGVAHQQKRVKPNDISFAALIRSADSEQLAPRGWFHPSARCDTEGKLDSSRNFSSGSFQSDRQTNNTDRHDSGQIRGCTGRDVLLGNVKHTSHRGNAFFLRRINQYLDQHSILSREKIDSIIHRAIDNVVDGGGRFLREANPSQDGQAVEFSWVKVEQKCVVELMREVIDQIQKQDVPIRHPDSTGPIPPLRQEQQDVFDPEKESVLYLKRYKDPRTKEKFPDRWMCQLCQVFGIQDCQVGIHCRKPKHMEHLRRYTLLDDAFARVGGVGDEREPVWTTSKGRKSPPHETTQHTALFGHATSPRADGTDATVIK